MSLNLVCASPARLTVGRRRKVLCWVPGLDSLWHHSLSLRLPGSRAGAAVASLAWLGVGGGEFPALAAALATLSCLLGCQGPWISKPPLRGVTGTEEIKAEASES